MKKYLLFTVAMFAATTGYAQSFETPSEYVNFNSLSPKATLHEEIAIDSKATTARVRKSAANGVYYAIPKGTFYSGPDKTGSGIIGSRLIVPPFTELVYENKNTTPSNATWSINGTDVTQYAVNNNYVSIYSPKGSSSTYGTYYVPVISDGTNTYQFGDNNYYVKKYPTTYKSSSVTAAATHPEVTVKMSDGSQKDMELGLYISNPMGSIDNSGTIGGNLYYGYGRAFDTGFLCGSGTYQSSTDYKATMFAVPSEGLAAPLYAEDLFITGLTYNTTGPIPAGDTIYAYITTDLDTVTFKSGAKMLGRGNTVIATLYATATDTLGFKTELSGYGSSYLPETYRNSKLYRGTLIFHNINKTVDPLLGYESNDPIVIPEGVPFSIVVTGLDKTGVNFGAYVIVPNDEDIYSNHASLVYFSNGEKETCTTYSYAAELGFTGRFEKINVPTTGFLTSESKSDFPTSDFKGWNVLRVSADGQTVSTEGLANYSSYNLGKALVGTTSTWYDSENNPYYDFDVNYVSGEGWITSLPVDTTPFTSSGLSGYNYVTPVCSALPSGVTGRAAKVTVTGRGGIAGDNQIIILQGDASYTDGIESVAINNQKASVMSNKFYNLSGQEVSKEYKGIVINNGKKFMR